METRPIVGNSDGERVSDEDPTADGLLRQNYELRHRLEEETASYKRRLDTYRQAQQHQAALVSRLQAKASFHYRNQFFFPIRKQFRN